VVVAVDAVAEIIAAQGRRLEDEDGREVQLVLGPGLSDDRIDALQASIGVPLPAELRDVLRFTREIDGALELLDFTGEACDVALDDTFGAGLPIAADGYGNFWVLDLGFEAREQARVFYVCHDPPVVLYQAPTLADFLREAFRMLVPPHDSLVDDVHEDRLFNVWGTDHGLLSHADALAAGDGTLREFAARFDDRHTFADLRAPQVGEGFAWGRHGPRTIIVRHEDAPIFAITAPEKKPGLFRRLMTPRG
jgi:hypothetical protein